MITLNRRPNTQEVTWFLDLHTTGQLDLNPPYQRRSVWTLKDKRFFLDTIFRNFPCPPIFLHKSLDEQGKSTYHVVDGKQRLQSILSFVNNEFTLSKDFGDSNLDGKKWEEINPDYKRKLWDYVLAVDYIDDISGTTVNDVFDRVNRNQKKLERQELRHARFTGWFVSRAEDESKDLAWKTYGIATTANIRRMRDIQFISELMIVAIEKENYGFDQDLLDEKYALYDDPAVARPDFNEEIFEMRFAKAKEYIENLENANSSITKHARSFTNFYSIWAHIVFYENDPKNANLFAEQYSAFMSKVEAGLKDPDSVEDKSVQDYINGATGASTDSKQRRLRQTALAAVLPLE
jgi:hypothetical protein